MQIITYKKKYQQELIEFLNSILYKEYGSKVNQERSPDIYNIENTYLKDGGNFWLLLDNNKKIAGTIAIRIFKKDNNKIAYLKRIYLKKELRGHGYGKQMLETAINYCQKNTINEIILGTNPENKQALKLFNKMGFKEFELYEGLPTFGDKIFMQKKCA